MVNHPYFTWTENPVAPVVTQAAGGMMMAQASYIRRNHRHNYGGYRKVILCHISEIIKVINGWLASRQRQLAT